MKIGLVVSVVLIFLVGCSTLGGIADIQAYSSPKPYSGEPKIIFGAPTGQLPIFQIRYIKSGHHAGLPYADEIQMLKKKGAEMGANTLVFNCPPAGTVGYAECFVYGY